jgi:hypothetical protein
VACKINGTNYGGKLTLFDQSVSPTTGVTWTNFLRNPGNPNWVPQYDGPNLAGHPNDPISLTATFQATDGPITYTWSGLENCRQGPMGGYVVVGFNYDVSTSPHQ